MKALTRPVIGMESGLPPAHIPWRIPHGANNAEFYDTWPWSLDVEEGELQPFVYGGGGADGTYSTCAGIGTSTDRQFLWTSARFRSHAVRTTEPVGRLGPLGTNCCITPRYNFDTESAQLLHPGVVFVSVSGESLKQCQLVVDSESIVRRPRCRYLVRSVSNM